MSADHYLPTWFHDFQIPNFLEFFHLLKRDFVFVCYSKFHKIRLALIGFNKKSEKFGIRESMWWVEELNDRYFDDLKSVHCP